jgi:hypothetical protein
MRPPSRRPPRRPPPRDHMHRDDRRRHIHLFDLYIMHACMHACITHAPGGSLFHDVNLKLMVRHTCLFLYVLVFVTAPYGTPARILRATARCSSSRWGDRFHTHRFGGAHISNFNKAVKRPHDRCVCVCGSGALGGGGTTPWYRDVWNSLQGGVGGGLGSRTLSAPIIMCMCATSPTSLGCIPGALQ